MQLPGQCADARLQTGNSARVVPADPAAADCRLRLPTASGCAPTNSPMVPSPGQGTLRFAALAPRPTPCGSFRSQQDAVPAQDFLRLAIRRMPQALFFLVPVRIS